MKTKIMMAAVLGAMFLTACEPVEPEKTEEMGTLSINVQQLMQTKAASTEATAAESQVNKMRVLVYDSSENLYKDIALESPYTTVNINNVKKGQYIVCALANTCAAVSNVNTKSSLYGTAVSLSDCGLTASKGFVMFGGKNDVNVQASTTPTATSITVTRYPARVKLVSVKNELPASLGDLTVESVMLINGFSSWVLSASGSAGTMMNPAGRKNNGTGDIIASASDANFSDYSFKAVPEADRIVANGAAAKSYGYCFYSFPNTNSSEVVGPKQTGGKARLVVKASFNNKSYYYPVTLVDGMQRNKCYEVSLVIGGTGSEDPNVPVEKGIIGASISVKDWVSGGDYSETI